LGNRSDVRLFVGREREVAEIVAAGRRDLNLLVVADPGMGKTSLLRAVGYRLRSAEDVDFHYVRAAGVADGAELLALVAVAVGGDAGATATDTLSALTDYARPRRGVARRRTVIALDDVGAVAGHAVFGRLRDEMWSLGWRWIVATSPSERGGLLMPPADAFFESVLVLAPLASGAAGDLLRRRLPEWDDVTVKALVEAVGGNPRRLLDAARTVADAPEDAQLLLDAVAQRDEAIARAGRPEAMLAAELDAIGSASASDDALLARLGWTRSRAVQVLGRLEELGLVRGSEVATGRGRPRRVFRLVTPTEYAAS
jgi:DNA replicative helicase MCM subunit Mcm2 (Cdc46/Mcm family)